MTQQEIKNKIREAEESKAYWEREILQSQRQRAKLYENECHLQALIDRDNLTLQQLQKQLQTRLT